MIENSARNQRIVTGAAGVATLAALASYAWRGWYTRYLRDDFCTAATATQRGFLAAVLDPYLHWSGRFSFFAIKAAFEKIGPFTARIVPALMIAAFVVAAFLVFRRVSAALVFVFALYAATPDVLSLGGPLMWETGAITYTLPLILLTLFLALLSRGSLVWRCIAGGALSFVAGGLSETSLVAQGAFVAALFVAFLVRRDRERAWIAASGLAATFVALRIVAAAPGNSVRMAQLPPQQSLFDAVPRTAIMAYDYIGTVVFTDGAALLVVLAMAAFLGASWRARDATTLALVASCGYVASFLPGAWMLSGSPPPRALHVTNFYAVIVVGCLGVLASRWRKLAAIAVLVCCVIPLWEAVRTVRSIDEARATAAELDRITTALAAGRGRDVVIRSRYLFEAPPLREDPASWENECLCRYYGARSLRLIR